MEQVEEDIEGEEQEVEKRRGEEKSKSSKWVWEAGGGYRECVRGAERQQKGEGEGEKQTET